LKRSLRACLRSPSVGQVRAKRADARRVSQDISSGMRPGNATHALFGRFSRFPLAGIVERPNAAPGTATGLRREDLRRGPANAAPLPGQGGEAELEIASRGG
jgi:hypothetical protein